VGSAGESACHGLQRSVSVKPSPAVCD